MCQPRAAAPPVRAVCRSGWAARATGQVSRGARCQPPGYRDYRGCASAPARDAPAVFFDLVARPGSTIGRGMPLVSTISTTADDILEQWIREAVRRADQVIYHCNADYDTNMASTLTLALVYKRHLYVASVGDSRAYYYSPDKGLKRITTDHTLGTGQVDASQFKPEEIYTSPKGK